jgi:hypothetical protein
VRRMFGHAGQLIRETPGSLDMYLSQSGSPEEGRRMGERSGRAPPEGTPRSARRNLRDRPRAGRVLRFKSLANGPQCSGCCWYPLLPRPRAAPAGFPLRPLTHSVTATAPNLQILLFLA